MAYFNEKSYYISRSYRQIQGSIYSENGKFLKETSNSNVKENCLCNWK